VSDVRKAACVSRAPVTGTVQCGRLGRERQSTVSDTGGAAALHVSWDTDALRLK